MQKVRVCTGDLKDTIETQTSVSLRSTVQGLIRKAKSHLYLKAEESALEVWRWMSKGNGEDWSSSEEANTWLPSSFPCYSIQAISLLVGATFTQGGSLLFSKPNTYT